MQFKSVLLAFGLQIMQYCIYVSSYFTDFTTQTNRVVLFRYRLASCWASRHSPIRDALVYFVAMSLPFLRHFITFRNVILEAGVRGFWFVFYWEVFGLFILRAILVFSYCIHIWWAQHSMIARNLRHAFASICRWLHFVPYAHKFIIRILGIAVAKICNLLRSLIVFNYWIEFTHVLGL